MFKKYFSFIFIFFILVGADIANSAVNYKVSGIKIDELSDSATQARQIGITKGQRTAFIIMLGRLGIDSSYAMWFSNEEIAQTIESRRIEGEKFSKKRYSANLTVTFSESFMKYALESYGIGRNSTVDTYYLVIPTQKVGEEVFIWDKNNQWMQNWKNVIGRKGVKGIVLPKGDIDDISMITQEEIIDPYYESFENIIKKYNVDGVMIAEGEHIKAENKMRINLTKISKKEEKTIKLDYFNMSNLKQDPFFNNAAQKTVKYIAEVELSKGSKGKRNDGTEVYIPVSEVSDWAYIKERLDEISSFKNVQTMYITQDVVKINITHKMDIDDLTEVLEESGLYLMQKNDKYYFIYSNKTYKHFN
jgi:hypothetical protein